MYVVTAKIPKFNYASFQYLRLRLLKLSEVTGVCAVVEAAPNEDRFSNGCLLLDKYNGAREAAWGDACGGRKPGLKGRRRRTDCKCTRRHHTGGCLRNGRCVVIGPLRF